jgi:hypothetical protein
MIGMVAFISHLGGPRTRDVLPAGFLWADSPSMFLERLRCDLVLLAFLLIANGRPSCAALERRW